MNLHAILYLVPTPALGGAEATLLSLLECIDRDIFDPLVILPAEGVLSEKLRAINARPVVLPLHKGNRKNPLPFLRSVWGLFWLIQKHGIDLVHANHEFTNRHAALASRLVGIPQICHVRNIQTQESLQEHWLRMSPFLIANSQATARSYEPFLRPSQKPYVVYSGVDLNRFDGARHSKRRFSVIIVIKNDPPIPDLPGAERHPTL